MQSPDNREPVWFLLRNNFGISFTLYAWEDYAKRCAKKMTYLTLFPSWLSWSLIFYNVEFDDFQKYLVNTRLDFIFCDPEIVREFSLFLKWELCGSSANKAPIHVHLSVKGTASASLRGTKN